jgi:hypothetical protein
MELCHSRVGLDDIKIIWLDQKVGCLCWGEDEAVHASTIYMFDS